MKDYIIISDKKFKRYDENYFISDHGDVYSLYSKSILKHEIDIDGYHRVSIHGKHKKIHRLVYYLWVGKIPKGLQINHKDDNKNNNYYKNLYAGSQKENVKDKMNNSHRVGNLFFISLYDENINDIITFCPASDFIDYCGHPSKNGSIKKFFNKKWFKKRYHIIEYKKVNKLNEIESVTTKCYEFNTVE